MITFRKQSPCEIVKRRQKTHYEDSESKFNQEKNMSKIGKYYTEEYIEWQQKILEQLQWIVAALDREIGSVKNYLNFERAPIESRIEVGKNLLDWILEKYLFSEDYSIEELPEPEQKYEQEEEVKK
jgi:hypothetical protein